MNLVISTALPSATMSAMSTEMTSRSLLIKITCGAEAAERANQAWTVAAMGVAAGASVSVWLTGEAVWFAVPGRQPDLELPCATPVAALQASLRRRSRRTSEPWSIRSTTQARADRRGPANRPRQERCSEAYSSP